MKKILILTIIILLLFGFDVEKDTRVLSYTKEEEYKNYLLSFNECVLNTNNFISKFSYFYNKDYKILKIVPYKDLGADYLFYTSNLEYVIDVFKNKYVDSMLNDSKYVNNICIKEVGINTSNYILDKFKSIIDFEYT